MSLELETVIAGALPSLAVAALTGWVRRSRDIEKKMSDDRDKRLDDLEKVMAEHMKLDKDEHRSLDVRLAETETVARGHAESQASLMKFIDAKFEALDRRIDDALRRSTTPIPGRRR